MDPANDGTHCILPKGRRPSSLSMTEPVEILDEYYRSLRTKHITLVKLLWRGQTEEGQLVEKTTWESEDFIEHHYPGLLSGGKSIKKVKASNVPSDVFEVICENLLDFDDLFQLAGVCKEWKTLHKSYWENFMSSQAPLLLQTSFGDEDCYFLSLSEQKVFCSNMMEYARGRSYAGFSCGYVIISLANNSLSLTNPFTRRMRFIDPFERSMMTFECHAMIAYVKGSEEFIIVLIPNGVLIPRLLIPTKTTGFYIYQSRNSCWENYVMDRRYMIIDSVVFDHTVYFITDEAEIGVARLTSTALKFLELNNVPQFTSSSFKLVSCDGNLLVVHFVPGQKFEVYQIDLLNKNWVRLETLGDVALFYAKRTRCYALSNPGKWGYEKNCVYYIGEHTSLCNVYSMNDYRFPRVDVIGEIEAPPRFAPYWTDWCFRHVRDEVKLE